MNLACRTIVTVGLVGCSLLSDTKAQDIRTMFSPEVMEAVAAISIESQTLQLEGFIPSVIFQAKNNSSHTFAMLIIECSILSGGKVVATAEGFLANFGPGQVAASDAPFQMTRATVDATDASCRPSMGM